VNDRKHILVGLFVLGGLILLAILIVWFRGVAGFLKGGYEVQVHLNSSQGVRDGKPVNQDGLPIGSVLDVASSLPDRPGVWARVYVIDQTRIPTTTRFVAQQTTLGEVFLDFQSPAGTAAYPAGEYLPTDGTARLEGYVQPVSLLPEKIVDDLHAGIADLRKGLEQFQGLGDLIANLKELTAPRSLADVKAGKHKNLWTTLEQFEAAAESIQGQIQNPDSAFGQLLTQVRKAAEDLHGVLGQAGKAFDEVGKAVATFDEAGKAFKGVGDSANAFIVKLSKDAERLTALLDNVNGMIADVRQGKGTLGQLLTNDQMHRELVNLIESLQIMGDNANRLVTMWRERGLFAKEGK
jgi:phospholipid/cholesterol/gamma-HCH transport system substrate-binding protein